MIDSFKGEYRFLSNFWPAVVVFEGITYPTTEHAYQAAKTLDQDDRLIISLMATPGQAKRAGRKIVIRDDWNDIKVDVMRSLLEQKFNYPELKQQLLATGTQRLVEGNTWGDVFWGVCRGKGENILGNLLMVIRRNNNV